MPPKPPNEITDSSNDADAKPPASEELAYPQPFVSRKLHEMSDDFVEEYRSGPNPAGEVAKPWGGKRTDSEGPGVG